MQLNPIKYDGGAGFDGVGESYFEFGTQIKTWISDKLAFATVY